MIELVIAQFSLPWTFWNMLGFTFELGYYLIFILMGMISLFLPLI
jgi:hypothetical protein